MPNDYFHKRNFDGKKKNDSNILLTLKKNSQFKRCGIIKILKFKICLIYFLFQEFAFITCKWGCKYMKYEKNCSSLC
jgi:hypothetical protein